MTKNLLTAGFLVILGLPFTAGASLITGVLSFDGTASVSLASVGFVGNVYGINGAVAQTGGFVALAGTAGTIQNISDPPDAVGPLDIPDFMTFDAAPNITFTLTFLPAGIDGAAGCFDPIPAAGQVCTPDLPSQSPDNLQNLSATSSSAGIDVDGLEIDSLTNTSIPVTGVFTTQFSNMNYQQILADVLNGGTIVTSFSAEFSTGAPAPEPGTSMQLLVGIGAVGLGVVLRKKFARA